MFDLGQVAAVRRLLDRTRRRRRPRAVRSGDRRAGWAAGYADAVAAGVAALPKQVTSWSATGIGRTTLAVAMTSLAKGGHLRVGMEDVLTISKGVPVESNTQLVERAVALGAIVSAGR